MQDRMGLLQASSLSCCCFVQGMLCMCTLQVQAGGPVHAFGCSSRPSHSQLAGGDHQTVASAACPCAWGMLQTPIRLAAGGSHQHRNGLSGKDLHNLSQRAHHRDLRAQQEQLQRAALLCQQAHRRAPCWCPLSHPVWLHNLPHHRAQSQEKQVSKAFVLQLLLGKDSRQSGVPCCSLMQARGAGWVQLGSCRSECTPTHGCIDCQAKAAGHLCHSAT